MKTVFILAIGGGIAALLWAASRGSVPVGAAKDNALQPAPAAAPAMQKSGVIPGVPSTGGSYVDDIGVSGGSVHDYSGNVAASIVSLPVSKAVLSPTPISAWVPAPSPARQIPVSQLQARAIYSSVPPRVRMLAVL